MCSLAPGSRSPIAQAVESAAVRLGAEDSFGPMVIASLSLSPVESSRSM